MPTFISGYILEIRRRQNVLNKKKEVQTTMALEEERYNGKGIHRKKSHDYENLLPVLDVMNVIVRINRIFSDDI
ncbi:hypothetical protein C5S35_14790 [Candidatus Methanophagaceae archaeon]|nr:hypothetical protein C5S35_14790 [Methanophagales archaeon]